MSFQLPEAIADSLLAKLGHDDEFRALFSRDARMALASLGFAEANDPSLSRGIWMCMTVNELASKETIRAGAAEMKAGLRAQRGVFTPFVLEARATRKIA
jgi:putative modified peptide